jgi:hypothetical protein
LTRALRKDKIILWVVADLESPSVTLKGWNHAKDVKKYGIPIKTKCDNIWLSNENRMRKLEELLALLKAE